MKRVLLVSSNTDTDPHPVYPLGLACLAAALDARGHRVEQLDLLASGGSGELIRARMAAFRPDYVCLSLRNLDECDALGPAGSPATARRLVALARETTDAPVILGGPAFSMMPEELLAFTGADHGVVGEGERLLCDLIGALAEGRTQPALLRGDRLLTADEIPSPRFDRDLAAFYLAESGLINLQTKRGCPHGCIYCSYPALEGHAFRGRDPRAVADDIEKARADHGADSFFFTDSVFNDGLGHHLAVAEEILRRGLSVRWSCYLRPAGVAGSDIALLRKAGLCAAELGTDAASDATLAGLGKGFRFEDVLETSRAFAALRLPCAHFVMFGGPAETMDTVALGLANLRRLEHCVVFACSGIRILPGTGLHARAIEDGVARGASTLREPAYYLSPQVDAPEMNRMIAAEFRGRRDRIFPPSEGRKRLSVMHRFGFRGLLWDRLIRFPKDPSC